MLSGFGSLAGKMTNACLSHPAKIWAPMNYGFVFSSLKSDIENTYCTLHNHHNHTIRGESEKNDVVSKILQKSGTATCQSEQLIRGEEPVIRMRSLHFIYFFRRKNKTQLEPKNWGEFREKSVGSFLLIR